MSKPADDLTPADRQRADYFRKLQHAPPLKPAAPTPACDPWPPPVDQIDYSRGRFNPFNE